MMFEQCHKFVQKLMPLTDETALRDVIDSILKVQNQQLKLAVISLTIGPVLRSKRKGTRRNGCLSKAGIPGRRIDRRRGRS
jgi:hypothetical protein